MKKINKFQLKDIKQIEQFTGLKVGYLCLLRRATLDEIPGEDLSNKKYKKYWICQCDCGKQSIVRQERLVGCKKPTRSCGCMNSTTKTIVNNNETKRLLKHRGKFVEITTGYKYGKLTAISYLGYIKKSGYNRSHWKLLCDCGTEVTRRETQIVNGRNPCCKSCIRATHKLSHSATWNSYTGMLDRCLKPNSPSYKRYGGIGIKVCPRWQERFSNFLEDMGERPANTTLDRINPFGDYEPLNCKWSSPNEQQENKRKNWISKLNDKDLVLSEHITADLFKCSVENLDNKDVIENILSEAAEISGSNIIHSFSHEFENQGLSSVLVLSESHISYHSFPEKKEYAAVDLFTCSKTGNSLKAVLYIANMLGAKGISISYFKRANNLGISKIKRYDFMLNDKEHLDLSDKNVVHVVKKAFNPTKHSIIRMDRGTER